MWRSIRRSSTIRRSQRIKTSALFQIVIKLFTIESFNALSCESRNLFCNLFFKRITIDDMFLFAIMITHKGGPIFCFFSRTRCTICNLTQKFLINSNVWSTNNGRNCKCVNSMKMKESVGDLMCFGCNHFCDTCFSFCISIHFPDRTVCVIWK